MDEGVLPQGPQEPQGPDDTNNEGAMAIKVALQTLTQLMMVLTQVVTTQDQDILAQENRDVGTWVNPNVSIISSRLRDFPRMIPPMFFCSNMDEDLQLALDEVYKLVDAMGVTSIEKAMLEVCQLKDVAQVWYTQWKDNKMIRMGHINWEAFKRVFLGGSPPVRRGKRKLRSLSTF